MAGRMVLGRLFVRNYSVKHGETFDVYATTHGAGKGVKMWKNLSLFVAIPTVLLGLLNTYLMEKEEEKSTKRPDFKIYEHLRIRNKRFPWDEGQRTLFHNPHRNALPDGYEAEEEHHH
ncbi:cytochrome c oxidase subunit 6A1, mitochondrial [Fopius arisanus]|uniref:Cytochrome c oxidase subunit 6A1, mitochondrial n=1 Tax=Fopius arisanus TaxID=64838 RepID=A0A9R1TMU4_9HYME|nr:PREDICTED: cytochrome c oxidase subunit 6A1, mitochondrial-like [Fopius arisanus]